MGAAPQQQQLPTSGVMGEVTPARGRGPSICRRGMYVLPLQVRPGAGRRGGSVLWASLLSRSMMHHARSRAPASPRTALDRVCLPRMTPSIAVQYTNTLLAASDLLICGWMGSHFMWQLLTNLDHSEHALPEGTKVTLLNDHDWSAEEFGARTEGGGGGW